MKEATRTANAAVNNSPEKFKPDRGSVYEGSLGHTRGGSSGYIIFDDVAYGGADLGT